MIFAGFCCTDYWYYWCIVFVDDDTKHFSRIGQNIRAAELWHCFNMVCCISLL